MYIQDDWPKAQDGTVFNGRHTLELARDGRSPFRNEWDVLLLVHEIEKELNTEVVDIPFVSNGSNNYVSFALTRSLHSPWLTPKFPDTRASICACLTAQIFWSAWPVVT